MNLFEQLLTKLDELLAIVRDDSNDPRPGSGCDCPCHASVQPGLVPCVRCEELFGTVGTAQPTPLSQYTAAQPTPLSQYTADTINPCPVCGRRCDFEECLCVDGCVGDGDHLRRLMDEGKGPSR